MKKRIKLVQQILKEKGLYDGAIDGIAGPITMKGLSQIEGIDSRLPKTRQITTIIQMDANERGIDAGPVDGLWGPQTNAAFKELEYLFEFGEPQPPWRPEKIEVPNTQPMAGTANRRALSIFRGERNEPKNDRFSLRNETRLKPENPGKKYPL